MSIIDKIAGHMDELVSLRQQLHAHPEIGFEEHRTSDLITQKLTEWGIDITRGLGRTGVVGTLRRGDSNRSIGLRADMDALPICETSKYAYSSKIANRMHACGHDGHTTMLLGAAQYLATSGSFDGIVHLIFQPAEETLLGASAMLNDGLLEKFPCDSVFALHNRPGLPVGKFAIRPGIMMAGGANFDINVKGKGGHAARPEQSIDPLLAICHIVTALQSVAARNVSPLDTVVVSVTKIASGDGYNTIPSVAYIAGTIRTLESATMTLVRKSITRVVTEVASGFGATAEIDYKAVVPPLYNDEVETTAIANAAAELVGEENINRNGPILMSSEDFSFILERCKGAYINIGNGHGAATTPLHSADYDFNDAAIPFGAALLARLAERKLPVSNGPEA